MDLRDDSGPGAVSKPCNVQFLRNRILPPRRPLTPADVLQRPQKVLITKIAAFLSRKATSRSPRISFTSPLIVINHN